MQRRHSFVHLVLAGVVVLGLTPLLVCVDAQAQIAFVSDRDGNWEIYVIDADGGNQQRLTNDPDNDLNPSWSPDGKRIAFASSRDGNFLGNIPADEIYVMDADGNNQKNLTNNLGNDISPSWSPDGKRIAFSSFRKDRAGNLNHFDIYVMDADGGNQQRLTDNPHGDQYPSWSPDGKRIAFSSAREGHFIGDFGLTSEIYVMDIDGGNQQRFTENPHGDQYPSWSPDGQRIIFSSRRDGHFRNDFGISYEIYVMDVDGGNQQRLTENRKNDWEPSWSPDGERIAFTSDRKGDLQNFEIYVIDTDGGNQQRLTNHRGDSGTPSWSPDGERIVFASDRNGNFEIYVMDTNGSPPRNLTNNPHGDGSPAWFGPAFAVASGEKKKHDMGVAQTD